MEEPYLFIDWGVEVEGVNELGSAVVVITFKGVGVCTTIAVGGGYEVSGVPVFKHIAVLDI